jgi:hypothetical protein
MNYRVSIKPVDEMLLSGYSRVSIKSVDEMLRAEQPESTGSVRETDKQPEKPGRITRLLKHVLKPKA